MSSTVPTAAALILALWMFLASLSITTVGGSRLIRSFGPLRSHGRFGRQSRRYVYLISRLRLFRIRSSKYRVTVDRAASVSMLLVAGLGFYSAIRIFTEFGF